MTTSVAQRNSDRQARRGSGDTYSDPAIVAASYERVSTRMQGVSGFSLGAQAKDVAQFAAEQGWSLPEHLRFRDGEEHAASGADWDLPGLTAMLAAAKGREFQVLVVPDPDRFARSMLKALVLEEQLRRHGVRVVYIRMPVEDTPEGRLMKNQMFSFAEYEREKIRFRTAKGRKEKAARGIVVGAGPVPYGYRYVRGGERNRIVGIEPDPQTAPVVAQLYRDALTTSGFDLAVGLRSANVTPPRAPWNSATVIRLLTNPVYSGRFVYGGRGRGRVETLAEAPETLTIVSVPPIVDRALWEAVQVALVRRKSQRRGRTPTELDRFALRGLLNCGHCGGALSTFWNRGRPAQERIRYYKCIRSEGHRSRDRGIPVCVMRDVPAKQLEAIVWQMVADTLLDPLQLRAGLEAARSRHDEATAAQDERLQVLEREIGAQRKRLERIVDELLDTDKGSPSYASIAQRRQATEDALRKLQAQQAEVAMPPSAGLSADQALDLEQFAAEVGRGIDQATDAERRRVYEILRLRGTLTLEAEGVKIGHRHSFDLDFQAVVPISNSASRLHNKVTVYPIVTRFLRLHLLGESPSGSAAD